MADPIFQPQSIERIYYQDGLFLTASLCNVEQNYTINNILYHNVLVYTPGTVFGLEVTSQSSAIMISAGMAIDAYGHQLVWPSNGSPVFLPSGLSDGIYSIYIAYQEIMPSNAGGQSNLIIECPKVSFGTPPFDATNLVLAQCQIKNNVIVPGSIDNSKKVFVKNRIPYQGSQLTDSLTTNTQPTAHSVSSFETLQSQKLLFSSDQMQENNWPSLSTWSNSEQYGLEITSPTTLFTGSLQVSGQMGIGVNDPRARLDVGGSFRVNGGSIFSKILTGKTIVQKEGTKQINQEVFYTEDKSAAFTTPPQIVVTPYAEDSSIFATTISNISTSSFSLQILSFNTNPKKPINVTLNWIAWEIQED